MNRFFRADSGYSNNAVFKALAAATVKYTIVLKDNIGRYVRKLNCDHLVWGKTKIEFFGSNECEVSMGLYPIKRFGKFPSSFLKKKKR